MSSDMQADVEVNLTGDLARKAEQARRAFSRFTTSSARNLQGLKSASVGLSNGIDRIGNKWTGMVSAGAIAFQAKGVIDFEAKLKDIEVQAGLTTERMGKIKKEIFDVAQAADVRIDPKQLLAGMDAIIEKTGDVELAAGNLRNIGVAVRATGAAGADIGAVISGLAKLDITGPEEVAQALEILVEQGKAGAFTMKDMAREAGPMLASMAAMGQKGIGAVQTMGALSQTTQMATDSASESSTAFSALIRDIAAKSEELQGVGVDLFDPEALKDGKRQFLDLGAIVRQIIEKSGGDIVKLGSLFGDESQKALKTLAAEYQKTGSLGKLDQFMSIDGTAGLMAEDAAAKAETMAAALDSIGAAVDRIANAKMAEPIQELADAINSIETDRLNEMFDHAVTAATAVAGIWAANKAVRGVVGGINTVQSLRRMASGGQTGGGTGGGTGAPVPVRVQPVRVTNWPPGGYGGGRRRRSGGGYVGGGTYIGGGGQGAGTAPHAGGSVPPAGAQSSGGMTTAAARAAAANGMTTTATQSSSWLRHLKKAATTATRAPVLITAVNAASIGASALQGDWEGAATSGGALAGGLAGAKLGAMTGMLAGPWGAALGGLIGGGVGAYLGEEGVRELLDWMKGDDTKEQDTARAQERLAASLDRHAAVLEGNTRALDDGRNETWRSHPRFSGLSPPDDTGGLMDGAP